MFDDSVQLLCFFTIMGRKLGFFHCVIGTTRMPKLLRKRAPASPTVENKTAAGCDDVPMDTSAADMTPVDLDEKCEACHSGSTDLGNDLLLCDGNNCAFGMIVISNICDIMFCSLASEMFESCAREPSRSKHVLAVPSLRNCQ